MKEKLVKKVYHGSPKGDIEELFANRSTHQKKCIYAADNKAVAMMFMGRGNGDLDTIKSYEAGLPILIERRPGVFDELYNKTGYIYEMDGNFSTTLDAEFTQTDYTEDDSGIAIKTDEGLVIMTGCGHRGICNTIEHAKRVTGESRVCAVLGGFHLRNLEKQQQKIDETIEYFNNNDIKSLYLGHCVTDEIIDYFRKNAVDIEIHSLAAGKNFNVFEKQKINRTKLS